LIKTSTTPFPSRLRVNEEKEEVKEIRKIFEQIKVNIPLLELIRKIPSYGKVLRECCTKKRKKKTPLKHVYLAELSSACLLGTLLQKLNDLSTLIIACRIDNIEIKRALLDLGVGVNVMPKSLFDGIQLTQVIIKLADRSTKVPLGMLEDVFIKVEDFIYPINFLVLETHPSRDVTSDVSLILGCPFLPTLSANINCRSGKMSITCNRRDIVLIIFGLNDEMEECFKE
jgi:hypothetical protein